MVNVCNSLSVEFLDAVFLRKHEEALISRVLRDSLADNLHALKAMSLILRYVVNCLHSFKSFFMMHFIFSDCVCKKESVSRLS